MDVGEGEGALAAVNGDHVVCLAEAAPARQRWPRRSLLPFADAEAKARGLAEHRFRGLTGALAADVAQAQRDGTADRHGAAAGGATHAARAVVDREIVATWTVHDDHREHTRRGGG